MTFEEYSGLSTVEAQQLLKEYGYNEINRRKRKRPLIIFLSQFKSPLIIILIVVSIVSLIMGYLPGQNSNLVDSLLILVIVFISAILGFIQEYKSEKTIEALQQMALPSAIVIRDGKEIKIKVNEIVPGDLVIVSSGDIVPADAKIIKSENLSVDESILTGESRAVEKKENDIIFMNTFVLKGSAKAVVIATGMNTKLGEIASKLEEIEEEKTPFDKELERFSKDITWIILIITLVILIVGLLKFDWYVSLLTAISLAVAAIPEGLPAVITLTLANAARIMSKKNALIRRLNVTESLGAVDVICTDKTGTLTEGSMKVREIYINKVVDADLFSTDDFYGKLINTIMFYCNDSKEIVKDNSVVFVGDETDIALKKYTKDKNKLNFNRIKEIPFSSERKLMSVIGTINNEKYILTKGAPEVILDRLKLYYDPLSKDLKQIDASFKERIISTVEELAKQGRRVLALAYNILEDYSIKDPDAVEDNLIFLALVSLNDPPRKEVKKAIKECKTAGIRTVMITGDNPYTALAIAKEIGIETQGIVTGDELNRMNDDQLSKILDKVNVFARVDPIHKLRILEALQNKNHIVAMTGDGVNDALALKKADVGIAMGKRGTDVAKEASDMILLDDNFATIVSAIKEGRRIFTNIRKFVNYLFVCNFAEVGVLFLATLVLTIREPILLPIHLLWINLLTDGLPALALGVDPPEKDIMKKPPRKINEPIINKQLMILIISIGLEMIVLLLVLLFFTLPKGLSLSRSMLFTGFILFELVRIASIRAQEGLSFFSNKELLLALLSSIVLQLMILYTPLNQLFKVIPLSFFDWLILIFGTIISYFLAILTTKLVVRFVRE